MALFLNIKQKKQGYAIFVEFSNGYGIKEGTSVTMRGINIGYIKSIQFNINSIIVLIHIQSKSILIPKYCLVETNQIGLFNNTVVDIVPIRRLKYFSFDDINVFSDSCWHSNYLCNNSYIKGYRGLNYDDLIRAATRISQRFDDPRFFHLLYLFCQNFIDISDEIVFIVNHISYIISLIINFVEIYLLKYVC
uniref:Mce/MlaD domain-containing protein n=1 Tax=Sphondylothamnion multifidum TaxID=193186 RepID=A0A4D6X4Z4_9FLOR|nr:hypothetical protein [Sphondylothamnion multifidum]